MTTFLSHDSHDVTLTRCHDSTNPMTRNHELHRVTPRAIMTNVGHATVPHEYI